MPGLKSKILSKLAGPADPVNPNAASVKIVVPLALQVKYQTHLDRRVARTFQNWLETPGTVLVKIGNIGREILQSVSQIQDTQEILSERDLAAALEHSMEQKRPGFDLRYWTTAKYLHFPEEK